MVLTGIGKDGTEGLRMIKRAGGVTLVQDAASCVVAGMPTAALAEGVVDAVVELHAMGPTLRRLACEGEGPAGRGEQ